MWVKTLYIFAFILFFTAAFSQPKTGTMASLDDADEHFNHSNYLMAIPIYKAELKADPKNVTIKLKLGICYLRTKINREESVRYLEEYTKDPKCDEEGWMYLGRAYLLANRIDEAMTAFNKFKTLKPKQSEEVARLLEYCSNAKKLMAAPVNVSFQNLGKEVNSEDPDYYPFISADETFLAFTSRRKDGIGGNKVEVDGYHPSDIYFSHVENGKWKKAVNAGKTINTQMDEQVVGLKADGLELYVYEDHIDKFGDLYTCIRKDVKMDFSKPRICDPIINEKQETSGCLSDDGLTMFFARREKTGATSDLYICRKLPTGKWALPQKLPEGINTPYNEDFPYLSSDGTTLYFASEGLNSMGGFDLFKTTWNAQDNVFSKPENLGYPINSTDDDRNICVTPDNRVAYISAFRPGGMGDLDIYRVKFNDNEQITKIYTGRVFMGDTSAVTQPKIFTVQIIVTNNKTKYEYQFVPNSKTGKFVMSLPVGKYSVSVNADGYTTHTEEITVSDIGKIDIERNKNFILKKK